MNKLVTVFIISSGIIAINAIAYCYFGLVEENTNVKFALKCFPAFILAIQSIGGSIYYRNISDESHINYCKYLFFAYILCGFGDFVLLLSGKYALISGLSIFCIVYVLFGSSRINNILAPRLNGYPNCAAFTMSLYILFALFGLLIALYYILDNKSYCNIYFISGVIIYFSAMLYAGSIYLTYYILNRKIGSFFAFAGITLFMLSDFLIILHDVKYTIVYIEIAIMLLYWTGITMISWSIYRKEETYIFVY